MSLKLEVRDVRLGLLFPFFFVLHGIASLLFGIKKLPKIKEIFRPEQQ